MTRTRLSLLMALFFLALSIVYGYLSYQIKLYPGDELEAMTARTLRRLNRVRRKTASFGCASHPPTTTQECRHRMLM